MARQISKIRILRDADGDVENVTVGDSLAEILDVDANITASCDLSQLKTVTADDFPAGPWPVRLSSPRTLESRYFQLTIANSQPHKMKNAIRGLFKELREVAPTVFRCIYRESCD